MLVILLAGLVLVLTAIAVATARSAAPAITRTARTGQVLDRRRRRESRPAIAVPDD